MKVSILVTSLLLSVTTLYSQKKDSVLVLPDDADITFTKTEVEAAFKGGTTAWIAFLNQNLSYPKKAVRKRIEGTVVVSFIVDREGHVTDITVLKDPGGGLAEEAEKIIKKSDGMWTPAFQNGRKVKAYKKQPIIFKIENG